MWVCALQSCLSDCQVNVAIDRVDRTRGYSHVTADRWEVQSVAGREWVCVGVCGCVGVWALMCHAKRWGACACGVCVCGCVVGACVLGQVGVCVCVCVCVSVVC